MRDRASTEDLITPCVSLLERLALDQVIIYNNDTFWAPMAMRQEELNLFSLLLRSVEA